MKINYCALCNLISNNQKQEGLPSFKLPFFVFIISSDSWSSTKSIESSQYCVFFSLMFIPLLFEIMYLLLRWSSLSSFTNPNYKAKSESVSAINRYISFLKKFVTGLEMFIKIGVLENFAIFTRKHPCWGLFLINLLSFSGLDSIIEKVTKPHHWNLLIRHNGWQLSSDIPQ